MQKEWEFICDECEVYNKRLLICLNCVETLCSECDKKIHNKGWRVMHSRVSTKHKLYEEKSSKFIVGYFQR